jgi:hypothetical protein
MNKPKTVRVMREYLKDHFRYDTMSSWNNSTSYARKVKLRYIINDHDLLMKTYDFLELPEAFFEVNQIMEYFAEKHDYKFQMGFNGRSNGYIVLYQGGKHESGQVFSQPGKGFDQGVDYDSWDKSELQYSVDIVWDFDKTVDDCIEAFIDFVKTHSVEDKTVMVPKQVRVAVPVGE